MRDVTHTASAAKLAYGSRRQVFGRAQNPSKVFRDPVASTEPLPGKARNPRPPVISLPHQKLERKVQGRKWYGLHERRACPRVAENYEPGRAQLQASLFRFGRLVDVCEDLRPRSFDRQRQSCNRVLHISLAQVMDNAFDRSCAEGGESIQLGHI